MKRTMPRGYFVLLVLVFSAVFLTLVSALAGFIFVQKSVQLAKENREKALHIAEAGLEYYRWFLAHNPGDLQDGTGAAGPYEHDVLDPEGGVVGTFSLDIDGEVFCGEVNTISISSTGWSAGDPAYRRTVSAYYTQPSVAAYSHIVDASVWAGADRVISGPYHANLGVRMDGTHNAPVTANVETWLCTGSFGCSPNQTQPGVFGSGSQPSLWTYPTPPIDFVGITVDLARLKGFATSSGGVYLGPSGNYGWRIVFLNNGSIEARRVTGTTQIWGYTSEDDWQQERSIISNTSAPTTYTIPASCPVIFVEDNVWLEGIVSGKAIIVAADVGTGSVDRSIIIPNNITYANPSGDGLTAIGEDNVLISLQSPNSMIIRGIFIAQKGRFGRNHYCQTDCSLTGGNQGLPSSLDPYVTRADLTTIGTVVSKERVGTKWTSGGAFSSGYNQRTDTYDRLLAESPPPFTPHTSDDFVFESWQEKN